MRRILPAIPEKLTQKLFPCFFTSKKCKDIHRGKDAQVPAEDLKTPYKCPAVGVELGGGGVNLGEEFPLKGREWEAHPDAFEHRLVHKEEGIPLSRPVIHTHRFPRSAGTNGDVHVMSAAESIKVIQVGIPTMILQVLKGCQDGALVQKLVGGPCIEGFIIGLGGLGWRTRLGVRARHGVNK